MTDNSPTAEEIRQLLDDAFGAIDPQGYDPATVTETILLRDGHYYGRAYRAGDHVATLTADPLQLRLYSSAGTLLPRDRASSPGSPRMAQRRTWAISAGRRSDRRRPYGGAGAAAASGGRDVCFVRTLRPGRAC